MSRLLWGLFGLVVLSACRANISTRLLDKQCNGTTNGNTITDVDGKTEMCLIVETERPFLTWRWSADGSTLAIALHDPTIIRPPGSGKFPNRPLTIHWYVMGRDDNNATELTTAHNKSLSLSPDGKYIDVSYRCSADKKGCHDIYKTSNQMHICSYTTYTIWFSGSDCPTLTLINGEVWDIEREITESACEFYREQKWDIVDMPQCNDETAPTVVPASTAIPVSTIAPVIIRGYPGAIPDITGSYPGLTPTRDLIEAYPLPPEPLDR